MVPEFGRPIHQLPLIPADVLKKHRVHEPLDTRFRSAARLLQALWREERGLPIGSYVNEEGKRRKLGSRISQAAGWGGGNFLNPEIAHTARRETAYREIGALIDAERLATNLLSSMPLTFNLLAPWGHAFERASGYLIELLPAFTGAARQLLFEHSPLSLNVFQAPCGGAKEAGTAHSPGVEWAISTPAKFALRDGSTPIDGRLAVATWWRLIAKRSIKNLVFCH